MKVLPAAVAAVASLFLAGCAISNAPASSAPSPTITKTVIKHAGSHAAPRTTPASGATPAQDPAATPVQAPASTTAPAPASTVPNVTNPWAVVSAYYGDVESGDYHQAWALLSSGMVTGQTYQQFVDGYACTGSQLLTELGESGDQVSFNLTATDSCNGVVQHFTGTDTVQDGRIVAANVHQTG
jgi:hypothetical protein